MPVATDDAEERGRVKVVEKKIHAEKFMIEKIRDTKKHENKQACFYLLFTT